ncbi:hypothetical protein SprV_0301162400 [Sparganum proliferum]
MVEKESSLDLEEALPTGHTSVTILIGGLNQVKVSGPGYNILATQFSTTMADEYADLKQVLHQQLKLMEALTVKLSNSSMGQLSEVGGSHSVDHIASSIPEFFYDPQAHSTYDSWYKRYEDLSSVDLVTQDNAWKVLLLLRKLGPAEHKRYANFILSKNL